jgi:hypothetical protein
MQLNGTIAFQKPKIGKGITNKNSKMGYSRVLGAPQTGSISMHVLLSFSPNPIWWDVILL